MITDHVWRPLLPNGTEAGRGPAKQRPCQYLECRRPRGEHERFVARRLNR